MRKFNLKDILLPTVILMVICAVTTALLGFTNEITKEPISQAEEQSRQDSMRSVSPDGVKSYEKVEINNDGAECYAALDEQGNILSYAVSTSSKGYGGVIKVMTGISAADGSVIAVSVYDNSDETPGLGAKTSEDKFCEQFSEVGNEALKEKASSSENFKGAADSGFVVAKDADKYPDNKSVDAVTGATISSRAVVSAVNEALEIYRSVIGGAE